MPRLTRLAVVLVLSMGSGCSLSLAAPDTFANACVDDGDCDDAVCDAERGMCVTVPAEPLRLGVMITADGLSEGVTFPAFEVEGPLDHDFSLPSSILVAGKVRQAGTTERIPAQLRFVRATSFEGGSPLEVSVSTSSEAQELSSGVVADYQARVPRGKVYDIRVEPTGEAARVFPPLFLEGTQAPEEGDIWNLDVSYPDRFSMVQGSIVSVIDGEEVPENGLQVRAVEASTGRLVSSTAITGMTSSLPLAESEPGTFSLQLTPGVGPILLRISGGESRPLFPTLTVDPDLVYPGAIVVPRLEPVRYEALVEGNTPSGRVEVPGAVVTLRSHDVFGDLADVTGTFRTTASTDEHGHFAVDVLPGTYDVVVTPSGQPDLAVIAQRVRIEGDNEVVRGQLFTVPQRARLGGSLEVWDGRPVVGASVRASALRRALSMDDVAGGFSRSTDSTTDANGLFTLRLDTGVYDVTIRPPSGSRFPWIVSPEWVFDRTDSEVNEHFLLPAPVPVRGLVHNQEGAPLAGAELKAHAIVETPEGDVRTIEVARAVTDADGRYELLLPPHL